MQSASPGAPLIKRLILMFFSTAFVLIATTATIVYLAALHTLQAADDQVVDKRAAVIFDILHAPELNDGLLAHEINEDNQGPRQIFMRVVSDFSPIAIETEGMGDHIKASEFPVVASRQVLLPERRTIVAGDGRTYRVASFNVDVKNKGAPATAVLQVATDTSLDEDVLSAFRRILYSVIGAAIPLCALCASYTVKRGLQPLERIATAAKLIDGASLNQRIQPSGLPAELHEIALNFNSMLSRLEATWLDLKHYSDTIAHELRTPLNRMRLDCELALGETKSEAEIREVLANTAGECERLTRLLQGLLFLSRVDSKQAAIVPATLSLADELATICDYFQTSADSAGVTLAHRFTPGLFVRADRALLQQAMSNLITNAIDHTPLGGSVTVTIERSGTEALIHVVDTGSGIAPEHHAHLFDRFYRGADSDTTAQAGQHMGLGLSIVKSIAELHGGHIAIESAVGRGTRATLALPIYRPET